MAGWEMKILTAEAHRLLKLAAQDADLRADLRALAQEILAATEEPPPTSEAEAAPQPPSSGDQPAPRGGGASLHGSMPQGVARVRESGPLGELTWGRRPPAPI